MCVRVCQPCGDMLNISIVWFHLFLIVGHVESMFGAHGMACWGIAPSRHGAAPEVMGFGVLKLQVSGFCNLMALDFLKCATAFEQHVELRNGRHGEPVTVQLVGEMIKELKNDQVAALVTALGPDAAFNTTMGAGSIAIIPPGMSDNTFVSSIKIYIINLLKVCANNRFIIQVGSSLTRLIWEIVWAFAALTSLTMCIYWAK